MRRMLFSAGLATLALGLAPEAYATCTVPNTLTNGQTADATQVMGNFNQITTCINSGNLTVPPVAGVQINGSGGTATVQAPSIASNYNFNLPTTSGTSGQVLVSGGGGSSSMYWATIPGTTLPPIADGIPVGRPTASSLAWRNAGPATLVEHANGPITITIPAQNGDQIRGIEQPVPTSTPYTITAKINPFLWSTPYFTAGVYLIDSNGKLSTLTITQSGNYLGVTHWNSVSSFNKTQKNLQIGSPIGVYWLRITNDGVNLSYYVSNNGADWILSYSESASNFLGSIVDAGVYGDNNDVNGYGVPTNIAIWSFAVETGSGTNSHW